MFETTATTVLYVAVPSLIVLGLVHAIRTVLWKRRAVARLEGRTQLSANDFADRYFADAAEEAPQAAALRELLASHLDANLDGLRPDDRLWDDLKIDLEADPDFFVLLDERFGSELSGPQGNAYLKLDSNRWTFRELLSAVRRSAK